MNAINYSYNIKEVKLTNGAAKDHNLYTAVEQVKSQ